MFTIATWNVNSLNVRLPHVLDWLKENPVEVLALQETKMTDDKFPVAEIEAAGYQVVFSGQKTYNGVAILSKQPATDIVTDVPGLDDPQRRIMIATVGDVRVIDLYIPNGSEVGSDKYAYKLDWLQHVIAHIKKEQQQHENIIVLGDFNIAPDDRDVHDPEQWQGSVLVSESERAAFQELLAADFVDVYRRFEDHEVIFSWWDYRQAAFRRNLGLRIDHILATPAMANRCQRCWIDKAPRKWERPSDHAPVVAEFS